MKFATTKERILYFIDYKGISRTIFFDKTSIKRGFLDGNKLNQSVKDIDLAKIIATYPELNLYWLISEEGEMLREKPVEVDKEKLSCKEIQDLSEERLYTIKLQQEKIAVLENELDLFKKDRKIFRKNNEKTTLVEI